MVGTSSFPDPGILIDLFRFWLFHCGETSTEVGPPIFRRRRRTEIRIAARTARLLRMFKLIWGFPENGGTQTGWVLL